MILLSSLWEGTDKNGNTYLSGNINDKTRVIILANTKKRQEKSPDYFLYLNENKKQENQLKNGFVNNSENVDNIDDIPF